MAEALEKQLEIADVYAAALFALASEAGVVEAVRSELEELVQSSEREPGLAAFLSSSAVDTADRRKSLERMFRGPLSDVVLDTLQVMNGHGRVHLLRPLLRCYIVRQEHAAGQVEVLATSAVELSPDRKTAVEKLAAELSGKKPLLQYLVDPDVIGGLVLQIGDYRLDYSVRRHLLAARAQMLERSARGLGLDAAQTP